MEDTSLAAYLEVTTNVLQYNFSCLLPLAIIERDCSVTNLLRCVGSHCKTGIVIAVHWSSMIRLFTLKMLNSGDSNRILRVDPKDGRIARNFIEYDMYRNDLHEKVKSTT